MKTCASCHRLFADERAKCAVDGAELVALADAPAPSDAEDPRVGKMLCKDRYLVLRRVADGAMGRVYEAYDKEAHRSVAFKILHADVAEDEVNLERFKREFELSAELSHEHVVEVLRNETTEDGGVAIVMEYLDGEELRVRLDRDKRLAPADVIKIVSQIALALEAPHARKIVHRDLKPENVFLAATDDGAGPCVKLLDFGSVRDNSEGARKITAADMTIGSPLYMSPEQAQGLRSLDHRADVWSVAAIAYEALTGNVPFAGADQRDILEAILFKDPTPPSVVGKAYGLAVTLVEVIELAVAKEPSLRFGSVGELADHLGAAYALRRTHREWASADAAELTKQIEASLPAALEAYERERAASRDGNGAFSEEVAMGIPERSKVWAFFSRLWAGEA